MKNNILGYGVFLSIIMPFSLLISFAAHSDSLRLVVTAGALAGQDPYQPFYNSRIFKGDPNPPFVIVDANPTVYSNGSFVFYRTDHNEQVASALVEAKSPTRVGFIGHSYRGILLAGGENEEIRRYLGADSIKIPVYQKKENQQQAVFAFGTDINNKTVIWPKPDAKLSRIPAVIVADANGSKYLLFARPIGSLPQRLGLVDGLLKDKSGQSSLLIDLGANTQDAKIISTDAIAAFSRRQPLAIFPGTLEMTALIQNGKDLRNLPLVYPFGENFSRLLPITSSKPQAEKIHLWSVTNKEALWPLYAKLGEQMDIDMAIAAMKKESVDPNRSFNIVRVFSDEAARKAAGSVYVGVVFLLAKDPFAQLASKETIELKQAKTDAYEQVAPIVEFSYSDVSIVTVHGPTLHNIQRVEIERHFITDEVAPAKDVTFSREVSDVISLSGEQKPFNKENLQKVLGGMVLSQSQADIALLEALPNLTTINSGIPFDLAKSLLNPAGNVIFITTTGKQIKKIAKLINSNVLSRPFFTYGMDSKTSAIGGRAIGDSERFKVALSETALLEVFGISRLGGLGEEYAFRAPFVESIYGDYKSFYYVGGPKIIPISDMAEEIERALGEVHANISFNDLLTKQLLADNAADIKAFIANAQGRPHNVLTFAIDYLDIGFSKNVTNLNYQNYQEANEKFPISRGRIPIWAHLFLYSKLALNYDTPFLQTSLANETKYMHTDLKQKPEKDKVKTTLKLRLPWERSVFKGQPIVVSPLFKTIYETKLLPAFWSDYTEDPRTQRLDSLLGVNVDFTKLGFNLDVGGTMAVDFNRTHASDAIDLGPAINFFSKWSLFDPLELSSEITSYYLFSLPNNQATNKIALAVEGTIWLRMMRFHDFSVAALSDFLVASVQEKPGTLVMSSIFGLTISYGRLFRLFG